MSFPEAGSRRIAVDLDFPEVGEVKNGCKDAFQKLLILIKNVSMLFAMLEMKTKLSGERKEKRYGHLRFRAF